MNFKYRIGSILIFCISIFLISPFIGIEIISPMSILSNEQLRYIFIYIRLPRTFAAFVAGGGLALAGMVYQAIFRNPLASPFTLGVSGGASFGAALTIAFGLGSGIFGLSAVTIGAFIGAVASVLVVYAFARSGDNSSVTLLLAGVVVATVCSGLIMFLHYITPLQHSFQIMRWIMGGVDGATYLLFAIMGIPVLFYVIGIGLFLPQLDLFLTGDSLAHSRGIDVNKSRTVFIVATALAVGAIVAVCGPIGFVGIIAPHICRMILPGVRHRSLALGSIVMGGTSLVICDTIARTIAPPAEIPVGIITALLGGPFFLLILFKRKGYLYI